jgi:hypothetical protein
MRLTYEESAAIANGTEKNISLCVPGKAETEDVLKKLVAGTYCFA